MSRIGRKPIQVPSGVEVKIDGQHITVKGPKGTLEHDFHKDMTVSFDNGVIEVTRPSDNKAHRSLHGLTRTLINNMVTGVQNGFSKQLEGNGAGYRAAKRGKNLVMNLGNSLRVISTGIDGIKIDVPAPNKIIISGPDKQLVGQFAANVREKRPPEPYKGKGIKYVDEVIQRKEGKTGKK